MMAKGVPKGVLPQVQGAQRRAQLVSLLSQAEKPLTINDIVAATGWGASGAAYTATKCAQSGLIKTRKDFGKNVYFMGDGSEESEESEVSTVKRRTRVTSAREVELVVAGVLVILGRNPASGRLRITLEEM